MSGVVGQLNTLYLRPIFVFTFYSAYIHAIQKAYICYYVSNLFRWCVATVFDAENNIFAEIISNFNKNSKNDPTTVEHEVRLNKKGG